MIINKKEMYEYYDKYYGIYTEEEMRKVKEYLKKTEEELNISVCDFLKIVDSIFEYVHTEEKTEEETGVETKDETQDDTEDTRQFVYDFFFNW